MRRSLLSTLTRRFGTRHSPRQRATIIQHREETLVARVASAQHALAAQTSRLPRARVVVVGGGFAGLHAAYELLSPRYGNAFEVTVLEASDRVGGRVHSVHEPSGRLVEAGAELIGINHTAWIRLCHELELGLVWLAADDDYTSIGFGEPLYLDGDRLTPAAEKKLYESMDRVTRRMTQAASVVRRPFTPWFASHAKTLDATGLATWLRKHAKGRALRALLMQFGNDNGTEPSEQSLLGNFALIRGAADRLDPYAFWTRIENARCDSGNDALAYALAQRISSSNSGEVHTKCPVSSIELTSNEVVVTANAGRDRKVYRADYIILAVPPSAWHAIQFNIDIAEGSMRIGDAVKFLSTVSRRFWVLEKMSPNGVNDELGALWEATENQMALGPQFVLSLFAGASRAMAVKALSRKQLTTKIDRMFPGYAAHVTGQELYDWTSKQWIWGGYSCPSRGQVTTVARFLHEPFQERLVFAGEHTCMAFFGYMEGALQSGIHASQLVARLATRSLVARRPRILRGTVRLRNEV